MSEHIARGVALILLVAVGPTLDAQNESTASRLTIPQIVERVTPSTVAVFGPTGFGSGVVVSTDGFIVTNHHVVDDQDRLAVQFPNQTHYYEAQRVTDVPGRDLALLKIDATNLTAATLGNATSVRQAEDVVVIGNPLGLSHTSTTGILTGFETIGEGFSPLGFASDFLADGTRLFQTDAASSEGNSGGGMFNDRAELIGIMTFKFTEGQNLNFAVPVNYVGALLRSQGLTTSPSTSLPNPLSPITPSPNNVNDAPTATPPTESVDAGRPTSAMANTRSWRSALVLLPILILLVAWFLRQQQEGS